MTCILAASLLCIHRMSRLLMNSSHSLAIVIIPGSQKGRQSIALTTLSSQPRCAKSTWKFEPKFSVLQATITIFFFLPLSCLRCGCVFVRVRCLAEWSCGPKADPAVRSQWAAVAQSGLR